MRVETVRSGQGRGTRRWATVALGVILAGTTWAGTAAAAPEAPATDCQTATAQLAEVQQQLTSASGPLGGLDPSAISTLTSRAETLRSQLTAACASAPALPSALAAQAVPNGIAPAGTSAVTAAADRDCPSFTSQPEAQAYFQSIGGSAARNADLLDRDRDGIACEDYPYVTSAAPVSTYPAGTFGQVSSVPSGGIETGDGSTAP
jgi:hypothetical protein